MADKRMVKGLLDVVVAEAAGEAWEVHPDMWLAQYPARDDAYLRALLEVLREVFVKYDLKPKPGPRGRPVGSTKDVPDNNVKAYACWEMTRCVRNALGQPSATVTVLNLIKMIDTVEEARGVPRHEQTFGKGAPQSHVTAVSPGNGKLGIDRDWNSATCEEILRKYSGLITQMT